MTLFKSLELLSVCGKGAEQYSGEQAQMLLLSYLDAIWEMLLPGGLLGARAWAQAVLCWLASGILTISLSSPFPTVTSSIDVCRSPATAQADLGAEARMRKQCLGTVCERTDCC